MSIEYAAKQFGVSFLNLTRDDVLNIFSSVNTVESRDICVKFSSLINELLDIKEHGE